MTDTKLPTKQTIEGSQIHQLKWMLYGPPGIGKSTFFSKAMAKVGGVSRAPLFLFTDPGLRFIKAFKKPIMEWPQFKQIVREQLVKANPKMYSMVVLDTADLLYRMCRQYVCKKKNISHVSDLEWGKGYDLVRDEFEQEIALLARWCEDKGVGLAFISHAKDVDIRGRTQKTNKLVPTLPKQAHEIIAPLCDIIGYAGFTEDKADREADETLGRVVLFHPSETVEAKDRTGMLPAKCRLDYDAVKECLEGGGEEEETEEEVVEE